MIFDEIRKILLANARTISLAEQKIKKWFMIGIPALLIIGFANLRTFEWIAPIAQTLSWYLSALAIALYLADRLIGSLYAWFTFNKPLFMPFTRFFMLYASFSIRPGDCVRAIPYALDRRSLLLGTIQFKSLGEKQDWYTIVSNRPTSKLINIMYPDDKEKLEKVGTKKIEQSIRNSMMCIAVNDKGAIYPVRIMTTSSGHNIKTILSKVKEHE